MKQTKILTLIIIAIISLYSCEKQTTNNEVTSQTVYSINPADSAGIYHNILLSEFMDNLEVSYTNGEFDVISLNSSQYKSKLCSLLHLSYNNIYTNGPTLSYYSSLYDSLNLNEWTDGDNVSELDLASTVLTQNTTTKDKNMTMNLLNDIYNFADTASNDLVADAQFLALINYHEQLILAEDWQSNEIYALGTIAIAKYSNIFWTNYNSNIFPYFSVNKKINVIQKPSGRSKAIVGADAAGYVIGGVTGAVSGSVLGPAGSVGGFMGGKLVGGFGASSVTMTAFGIYDAISDFF